MSSMMMNLLQQTAARNMRVNALVKNEPNVLDAPVNQCQNRT